MDWFNVVINILVIPFFIFLIWGLFALLRQNKENDNDSERINSGGIGSLGSLYGFPSKPLPPPRRDDQGTTLP
jgi:hypothetical protein